MIKDVLKNMPTDWLNLTTHRLDIYNESLVKVESLEGFEQFNILSFLSDEKNKFVFMEQLIHSSSLNQSKYV